MVLYVRLRTFLASNFAPDGLTFKIRVYTSTFSEIFGKKSASKKIHFEELKINFRHEKKNIQIFCIVKVYTSSCLETHFCAKRFLRSYVSSKLECSSVRSFVREEDNYFLSRVYEPTTRASTYWCFGNLILKVPEKNFKKSS